MKTQKEIIQENNKKVRKSNKLLEKTTQVWFCPSCKRNVTGYPALSRRDNKTDICTACGTKEAFEDFLVIE